MLLGGIINREKGEGFLMSTNESASHVHPIRGEVLALACASNGIVVATEDEIGVVDVSATGMIPMVSPIKGVRTMLQYKTIHSTKFILGGMFAGGVMAWDGRESQSLLVPALEPPCVYALAWLHGGQSGTRDFFAGGCFIRAGGIASDRQTTASQQQQFGGEQFFEDRGGLMLNGVARYTAPTIVDMGDGKMVERGPSWEPLGGGVRNDVQVQAGNEKVEVLELPQVYALSGVLGYLYVGGAFTHAGDILVNNVAKWDVSQQTWLPLGHGVDGVVRALAGFHGGVYVGGKFCAKESPAVCHAAHWSPLSGWTPLGSGVKGEVFSLLLLGPTLWAGGKFVEPSTAQFNVAVFKRDGWSRANFPRTVGVIRAMAGCPCDVGLALSDASGMCQGMMEPLLH